ncbi:hypothetical protein F2Q68_00041841 [Brassica cretica]|uniref:Uncharacterized protein n=1 Tax=Brassica cretica TaxID=69181 RepID=A0A8S9MK60_BRACR|nr:hypothetical protein F2Q68_00041841 [Brassica cretica]
MANSWAWACSSLTTTEVQCLLRFSEVRILKKGGALMGVGMFLLNQKLSGFDATSAFLIAQVFRQDTEKCFCYVEFCYRFYQTQHRSMLQGEIFPAITLQETNPLIIYLMDVEKLLESERFYKLFQILLNKISGPVLILGSRVLVPEDDIQEVDEGVSALFPYNIEIRPPEDESQLLSWKNRLEDDMKMVQFQDNKNQSIPHEPQYHCIFAGMLIYARKQLTDGKRLQHSKKLHQTLISTVCMKLQEYSIAKRAIEKGVVVAPNESKFKMMIDECN